MSEPVIRMENIVKTYYLGKPNELEILHGINLTVNKGEFVSIVGESGSGKSVTSASVMRLMPAKTGKIVDGSFTGDGCAISQASADIMLDLIIGREVEEAERLKESFLHMIKGEATDEEMELLEEAGALADISHMPARVKCAVLGWHTLENMLEGRTEA